MTIVTANTVDRKQQARNFVASKGRKLVCVLGVAVIGWTTSRWSIFHPEFKRHFWTNLQTAVLPLVIIVLMVGALAWLLKKNAVLALIVGILFGNLLFMELGKIFGTSLPVLAAVFGFPLCVYGALADRVLPEKAAIWLQSRKEARKQARARKAAKAAQKASEDAAPIATGQSASSTSGSTAASQLPHPPLPQNLQSASGTVKVSASAPTVRPTAVSTRTVAHTTSRI